MTPTRTLLQKECRQRGLSDDGNIKALVSRLTENEQECAQRKEKASKTSKPIHPRLQTKMKKKKEKKKGSAKKAVDTKTKFTTQDKPFPPCYTASQFVSEKYGADVSGDTIKVPEWRVHRHNVSNEEKIQLVLPRTRNTKGGMRLRWVLYTKKNL